MKHNLWREKVNFGKGIERAEQKATARVEKGGVGRKTCFAYPSRRINLQEEQDSWSGNLSRGHINHWLFSASVCCHPSLAQNVERIEWLSDTSTSRLHKEQKFVFRFLHQRYHFNSIKCCIILTPFTAQGDSIDFALSNARLFYSLKGDMFTFAIKFDSLRFGV